MTVIAAAIVLSAVAAFSRNQLIEIVILEPDTAVRISAANSDSSRRQGWAAMKAEVVSGSLDGAKGELWINNLGW